MATDFSDVAYRLDEPLDPRIEAVQKRVCGCFTNGGFLIGCFVPTTTVSDMPYQDLNEFLACPAIRRLMPDLQPVDPFPQELRFAQLGRYAFEGSIVELLLADGAYTNSTVSTETARSLAIDFVDAISNDSDRNVVAYRTNDVWTKWFDEMGWHIVTFIVDCGRRRWLICGFTVD